MIALFVVLHVLIAFCLVVIVLLQSGKGAMMGATLGAGQQLFGGSGGKTFFTRTTGVLAALFMANCIWIAWLQEHFRPTTRLQQKLSETGGVPRAAGTLVPLSSVRGDGSPVAGASLVVRSTAVVATPGTGKAPAAPKGAQAPRPPS